MVDSFCEICYEIKPFDEFIKIPICEHIFCNICMHSYLQNIYCSKEFYKLKCPSSLCDIKELDSVIKISLSETEYLEFIKAKNYAILSLDPNISWCPTPNCQGYAERNGYEKLFCGYCNNFFCSTCSQTWNDDHICLMPTSVNNIIKNLGLKTCPGCRNLVEKSSGCGNMTCRCGTIFCIKCGQIINDKHDGLSCLLDLKNESLIIIICLILSFALFPFHLGFYLVAINVYEIKDEEGRSIYTWKNISAYVALVLISPLLTILLIPIIPIAMIHSKEFNINKKLPKSKWFIIVKIIIWIFMYAFMLALIIVTDICMNFYLTARGIIALVKKICHLCRWSKKLRERKKIN